MPTLPAKDQQILAAHAGLVHAVVKTCHNRDLLPQLEQVLKLSEENGWNRLVASIRRILGGQRDISVLQDLDDEDRVITEAILRGLQNPETLPDLDAAPDPEHAAPGLASMVAAARRGNVEALRALADMATQMRDAGGDMARLASALSQMEQGEDDVEKLARGMNPAGIVFSEWPHIPESMYTKIAEPRLLTNQGWAVFIFTPEGKNHAHTMWKMAQGQPRTWFTQVLTVDDTKKDAPGEAGTPVVSAAQIQALRAAGRAEEIIQQEYFCSFEGFLRGTVYGDVITTARKEGRIGAFPYRADLRVHTAWDIGLSDGTAIWFYQTDGRRFTFIDFLFERGKGLHHFAHVVQVRRPGETGRPYVYGDHTGPHDLEIVEYSSQRGQTRREVARELGLDFRVAPKLLVAEGIDMARRLFSRCYFHETTCGAGLDHLGAYHYAWEERKQEYGKEPVHDEHSHAADAFRTFAVCPTEHNEGRDYRPPQRYAQSTWDPHGAGVSGRR